MSLTIPISFTEKFRDDFIMLAQQKESRLRRTVRDDPDELSGRFGYFDRIHPTEMNEAQGRHADTVLVNTEHSRRRIGLRDLDWADLIDKKDMRRILAAGMLPAKYRDNAVWAANRKQDDLIIAAATGNAVSIDENNVATNVPLPAGQIVAVDHGGGGNVGLTIAKLRQAKHILESSDIDEEEPRFFVATSEQLNLDLLATTEVTSSDFNTVKALAEGKINSFLGFEFIRSERLLLNSSGHRQNLAYTRTAMGLAIGQEIEVDIGPRRDKRNSTQVYVDMGLDATRVEDEKLVAVECLES